MAVPTLIVPVVNKSGVAVLDDVAAKDITNAVPPVPPVSDDIVAPAGMPAPEIAIPTASVAFVPEDTVVLVALVVKLTVDVEPVAADEMVIVVGLVIAVIYAPVGMLVPEIACPTDNVDVELTRTVVDAFVVAALNVDDDAVAAADITIELVDIDDIVAPEGIPVPLIGIPAYK